MVLHLSGICFSSCHDHDPIPLEIAQYRMQDWSQQLGPKNGKLLGVDGPAKTLEPNEYNPPGLVRCGNIFCLHGELKTATFGPMPHFVATLPEDLRPRRELRWNAALLAPPSSDPNGPPDFKVECSVALTIKQNGTISVQGGRQHMIDQKGNMRVLQQNKKGRLCLNGIRFSLAEGVPVEPAPQIASLIAQKSALKSKSKIKIDYLIDEQDTSTEKTAVCIKQGDVVMLEGFLSWSTGSRPPNAKQPMAFLPHGCWPQRREVFFTRGGSDLEERRRVDVDVYGRIFCPEGTLDGRLELTGVIFVTAVDHAGIPPVPPDADWDELKLQYHRHVVNVVSTSFDGHETLEQFVRRSNHHEWSLVQYDFGRHASRKMLLPLGQVMLRGQAKWDIMNIGLEHERLWREHRNSLADKFGITCFHTLLHVSDDMFENIVNAVKMPERDASNLRDYRKVARRNWAAKRQPGMTFSKLQSLATEIVDQMFQHWDFKAQLQGALQNDFRAPSTIEHLFPQRHPREDYRIKKKLNNQEDMAKFEAIRQFFYLYETTGCNMTHCSLMGSSDIFTTTGKWYFPDATDVQKQLFENIAWLFPRHIYLYISERQTLRFPFIEDLDVQASNSWQGMLAPGQKAKPPDELIMAPPERDAQRNVCGDPGPLMRKRAEAIHMIYPHLEFLEVLVYSASGYNKGKDMPKSSFHLVWPQLIVDPDRAPVIRHVTLGVFQKETMKSGSILGHLQMRLLQLHESNNWELVFDSTTINARNGLRLPYSDKASMVIGNDEEKRKVEQGKLSKTKAYKKRVREERPSKAIGRIRFDFEKDAESGNDIVTKAQWNADADTFTIAEWIQMGSCRRDPHAGMLAELTPWQLGPDVLSMLPTRPGEQFYYDPDGEGGHWVTHKPFPNIRRCVLEPEDFRKQFTEALNDEQDALKEEGNESLMNRVNGVWVSVTSAQAVWRTTAALQFDAKVPDKVWCRKVLQRPTEVAYIKSKGKVVLDGPADVTEVLHRVLKPFTKLDDNAVMPMYDLSKISH